MSAEQGKPDSASPLLLPAYPAAIRKLETLDFACPAHESTRLILQRISPKSPTRMGLEYRDEAGQLVAGQWVGGQQTYQTVVAETQLLAGGSIYTRPEMGLLLQLGGADRRLVGLAPLVADPQAELIVHRPERRAVVHLRHPSNERFAKVVPPGRVTALATTMQQVADLASGEFATPQIIATHIKQGIIWMSRLAGRPLYDLLGTREFLPAVTWAGRALYRLHQLAPPTQAATHHAADEVAVIERWLGWLTHLAPTFAAQVQVRATDVCQALLAGTTPSVLLHRDFFDKQIFVNSTGEVGLLDFDTLASGEAALDVANALVHFELRARQGMINFTEARAASQQFLAAYDPLPVIERRLQAYADATRLRLACVYACRPASHTVSHQLLTSIGTPLPHER